MIKTIKTSQLGFVAIAIASILTVASPAAAAKVSSEDVLTTKVDLRGIDLTSDAGLKIAQTKVRVAAQTVCPTSDVRDLTAMSLSRGCYNNAVTVADAQINEMRNLALRGDTGTQVAMVSASGR